LNNPSLPLEVVQKNIHDAAQRSGRDAKDVTLIAVSKKTPLAAVEDLFSAGQKHFGENQVQEAIPKIQSLNNSQLHWHFIGHLQSGKVKTLGNHFDWIHSIDSEKLIERLSNRYRETDWPTKLLLQVNIDKDPSKHGIPADELLAFIDRVLEKSYANIHLCGLMTIGTRRTSASQTRSTFEKLRLLNELCRKHFSDQFAELSMGMSRDYGIAIEEGATMVRVGTALFGERPTSLVD